MPAAAARSRWPRRLALAVTILAAIVVCVVALLPLLVDTDAVKRTVERRFAQSMGGEAAYESVSLNLFPRPRAEFSGSTVRVPGVIDGRIASVQVRFAWLPLLTGDVRPMAIRIERPVLEARIEPGQAADPFAAYRAALGPIADALTRHAAGMSVRIENGQVAVVYAGRPLVSLSELDATLEVSSEAIVARASAASDIWRAARSEVKITPATLAASGKLQVSGLLAARLLGAQPSGDALGVRLDAADATLDAATDGRSTLSGSLTASAPQAEIARAGRTVGLGAIRIALDVSRDDNALAFALRELRAGDLIAGATGTLRAKPDGTAPVLELQVPVLDAERAGAAALALAGDLASVRAAVDGVRDGKLRELTLHSAAVDLAGLAAPSRMRAEARLEAATVAVPAAGIVVKNGSGRFLIADGVLQGSELAGDIGRSSFRSGALAAAFSPAPSLRGLRGSFNADLADALAIGRRLLERGNPAALARIEALQGRASATVDYEAGRRASPLVVELKGIQATGRYRGVPFPLAVSRGDLRFSGDGVSARGIAGTAGGSSVSGAIDIVLGTEPVIRAAGGDATLVLGEVYPLVASLEHLRSLLGDIQSATGTAAVRLVRLSGSLSKPGTLDFDLEVRPRQVQLTSAALPGPVTLTAGSVSATPRALRLERLQAVLLDARVTASGTVEDYPVAERRVSLTLEQGSSGPEAIDWVRRRWKLPDDRLPRAPVALSAGRLEWTGGPGTALGAQGTASIAASVQAEFDLAWRPGLLDLRRFALKDSDSDAVFRLHWSPPAAELGFSGRLDYRTLERSFVQPPRTSVMLQGDFRAAIDLAEPRRSTADGTLAVEGLDLREHTDVPITIDRLHVEAAGRTLRVRDGVIRLAGERLTLSGTVESREERLALDGRVSADALDGARLLSALRRDRPGGNPSHAEWKLPVEGQVALTAGSFAYGGYVLQPFAAVVSLAPNRVDVEASDARLCGMAMPFHATLVPGRVEVSARLTARTHALAETVQCVARDSVAVTGTYDLDAEFSANGPADSLVGAARGSFRFAARGGRIFRAEVLSRTLAVEEEVTRTHAAPAKEMRAGGLAYDEIAVTGTFEAGRVRLEQGMLDSPSLGMTVSGEVGLSDGSLALQGLVAPLDTLHRVARRVPVVGRAFGTSLVVVPVSISGSVKDPDVKVLHAAAVGATLINLMTARFLMPVNLFDPTRDRYQLPSTK